MGVPAQSTPGGNVGYALGRTVGHAVGTVGAVDGLAVEQSSETVACPRQRNKACFSASPCASVTNTEGMRTRCCPLEPNMMLPLSVPGWLLKMTTAAAPVTSGPGMPLGNRAPPN